MDDSFIVSSSNYNFKIMSIAEFPMFSILMKHQFCIKCVYINIVVQHY